jgi:hypothetical protein
MRSNILFKWKEALPAVFFNLFRNLGDASDGEKEEEEGVVVSALAVVTGAVTGVSAGIAVVVVRGAVVVVVV